MAPEAPLWAFLDALGLPFRQTAGDLLAAHGTQSSLWSDHFRDCVLPSALLLPEASLFSFQWSEGDDPTLPPLQLEAHVRTARRHLTDLATDRRAERNLAAVRHALCPQLGPGVDTSVSNTRACAWTFGQARLEVTVFPLRLNHRFGQNQRHDLDPGSQHEASITLHPGWLPALTPVQTGWLCSYVRMGDPLPPLPGIYHSPQRWHRWSAAAGPLPQTGYGLSHDGQGFCVVAGDLVLAIPRSHILTVKWDELTPAKGGGGMDLFLTYAPPGLALRWPHRLTLARSAYAPDALIPEATALAHALDMPLTRSSAPDC